MTNELHSLIKRVEGTHPTLADDLRKQFDVLSNRREFGLNFERHMPEQVDLVGRRITVGDKVRFIPPRGETDAANDSTWIVTRLTSTEDQAFAELLDPMTKQETTRLLDDIVYIADFRDAIYPGLASSGRVERGHDKPFHTVINAEWA